MSSPDAPSSHSASYAQLAKDAKDVKEKDVKEPAAATKKEKKDKERPRVSVSGPVGMTRSRTTPEASPLGSPLLVSQTNPHPLNAGAFTPQAPIPLSHSWSFYLDDTNLWGVKSVEECLDRMGYLGTVDSIQAFWCYWNAMEKKLLTEKKLGAMSCQGHMGNGPTPPAASPTAGQTAGTGGNGRYNWRLFDSVITPVWEDETHVHGGKYVLRCGNGELRATKFIWTKIVLSMVGSAFLHQDVVCGAVLACRPHKKEIQVWVKHPPPKTEKPKDKNKDTEKDNKDKEKEKDDDSSSSSSSSTSASAAATSKSSSTANSTTTSSTNSPTLNPSPSPSPPAAAASSSSSGPLKNTHCTCHIDPIICFANDIRFLLGVTLANPATNSSPVKIEYIPHEVTMADVAARNKRLKHKMHSRRESNADAKKGKVDSETAKKDKEVELARAEREKVRAAEAKKLKDAEDAKWKEKDRIKAEEKKKAAAEAAAASKKPPPSASPLASPTSTAAHAVGLPGRDRKHTWGDVEDMGHEEDMSLAKTRSLAAAAMLRQSSDPTSQGSLRQQTEAIMNQLETLAREDTRTFEGTIGDAGLDGESGRGRLPVSLSLVGQSPAALELARQRREKGWEETPLKLSGERGYHPEPDSPGFNNTPVPSPSVTPLGFATPVDGGSTPTPRSPFTAHSPRGIRGDRANSMGGSRILTTARGAGRLGTRGSYGGAAFSPEASPESAANYADFPDDSSDLEDEQGMLQYDALSPSFQKRSMGETFQLDRTRDLLRVPLDLDNLSLPPAGKQAPQRLQDPASNRKAAAAATIGGNGSIFTVVGRDGDKGANNTGVVAPHAIHSRGDHLSKLLVAAQSTSDGAVGKVGDSGHSAFAPTGAGSGANSAENTPSGVSVRKGSAPDAVNHSGVGSHEDGVSQRKKKDGQVSNGQPQQQPQQQQQQQKQKSTKKSTTDEKAAPAKFKKPKSAKTLAIYAAVVLLAFLVIYLLFFTTLSPEPEPYAFPERTIADKSKIKVPKVTTK